MKLISNARHWWRMWSIQFNMIGLAILSWIQIDPTGVLMVWNMMPREVRDLIPARYLIPISMVFFALSMLSRVVSQPKIANTPESGVKGGAGGPEKS